VVGFTICSRGKVPGKTFEKRIGNNNNSIQFFIISVLHQQPECQLQTQHKGIQDNRYNKITTKQIIINYMAVEKVNT
jgi:hypothetical protein